MNYVHTWHERFGGCRSLGINEGINTAIRHRYRRVTTSSFREQISQGTGLQTGTDGRLNAYGTLISEEYDPNYPTLTLRTLPVICGHGGSAWLCASCADQLEAELIEQSETK